MSSKFKIFEYGQMIVKMWNSYLQLICSYIYIYDVI